jgi:lysophospholipase L1-like esterase
VSVAAFVVVLELALRLAGFHFSPGPIRVSVTGDQVARAFRDAGDYQSLPAYQPEGRYEDSPRLIWRPVAGYAPFNQERFIGPVLPVERRDRLRVACLGDSCTQLGSPPYPDVLRDVLSERCGKEVEVLNAGVIGYSTYQGLARLEQDVLPYRPDIVTIYFGWNDHGSIYTAPDPQLARDRRQASFRWVDYVGWSAVVQAGLWAAVELRRGAGADRPTPERLVLRVPLADYRHNLREMIGLCRSRGALPILVTAPTTLTAGPTPPGLEEVMAGEAGQLYESLPAMHAADVGATRDVARETGTALCDAHAAFGDGQGLIQRDYVHLRPEGVRRMAELLSGVIAEAVQADPALARSVSLAPTAQPGKGSDPGSAAPAAAN